MTRLVTTPALAALLALAACSSQGGETKALPPVNVKGASLQAGFGNFDRLVESAQKEGKLTVVGVPREWVNHGELMDVFADKYGIQVESLNPAANSQQQIDAVATAQKPDVFDLSIDVALANAAKFAPYQVTGWTDVPDEVKAANGAWYAGYGGYMSIGYDPRKMKAPASYAELLKPNGRPAGTTVALAGDPLKNASGFNGVMAASMQPSGQGAKFDARKGVQAFAALKKAGAVAAAPEQAAAVLDWDYLNAARAAANTANWQVTIPAGSILAAPYVQAISASAPHPAAARLWTEFLFSDEGQNILLRGYARPSRMEAMQMKSTLDNEAAGKLPKANGTPVFMTIPQQDEAKVYLQKHWSQQMS
ncbi:ABC transporter substrate-binding protein [Herbidospora daliensis]|uniref:ABC transporter substrate-binding protein n=1 Tax=Herbidospora daliensis TaxID=295585 RepID=UPI0009FC40E8|nr:ABC transporter substrate-binding protein [Herbidospora daliensis]